MKDENVLQVAVGFIVIVVCLVFVFHIYSIRSIGRNNIGFGSVYSGKFSNIDGISVGSAVKMSGIPIGTVKSVEIDKVTYLAQIFIKIDGNINVPEDSVLSIVTSGLLGARYVDIKPGISAEYLKDGDSFQMTSSAVSIENLISKFATDAGGDK